MNRKQLTTLLVLAVVLGGLGYYVFNKQQSSYERGASREEGQKFLQGVPPAAINDIANISIKQNASNVTLVRAGDQWTVSERGGYPANFANLSELVKKFWDLKVTRAVTAGPSRLPVLKLTKDAATLVELKDDKGKSIAAITLGLQTSKEMGEDSQFGGGAFPNGRYVMRGDDLKTIALVSDPLNVEAKAEDWLSKEWFKVEKARAVSVVTTNATNNWKLARETETGDWKFSPTNATEAADNGKAGALNWLLSSPSFNDVAIDSKPEATGLDKPIVATIETFEGFSYTLKIGAASGENVALQLAVTGSFPKERTAAKDEKPEDKTRLDKEFTDKLKTLNDKLKAEQAFEKWTYTVSRSTLENLLKVRADFYADKKDDTKKDDAKPVLPQF